MGWVNFITYHKDLLLKYFQHGCAKCIYGKICKDDLMYLEDFTEFTIIIEPSIDSNLELEMNYTINNLCDKCILNSDRTLKSIVFEITCDILERYGSKDFQVVLNILNKDNILRNPKEVIFAHYVKKCRGENPSQYYAYIDILLKLGINEDYPFTPSSYLKIFTFIPISEGITKNASAREIIRLLIENKYKIFVFKNKVLNMSKLVKFIIFG